MRAVPSISRMAWISDWRAPDQVVALGGEELEPLDLLRVLLDRERIDRADRLERADDARRLGFQRLQIEVEQRRLLDQLVEGRRHSASTRSTMLRRVPAASVSRTWSV